MQQTVQYHWWLQRSNRESEGARSSHKYALLYEVVFVQQTVQFHSTDMMLTQW